MDISTIDMSGENLDMLDHDWTMSAKNYFEQILNELTLKYQLQTPPCNSFSLYHIYYDFLKLDVP